MSEKLNSISNQDQSNPFEVLSNYEGNQEVTQKSPRFPNDPEQYTEEELKQNPEKRFYVNEDDFPIFSQQAIKKTFTDKGTKQNINYTLSRFVTHTADMVATISGEGGDIPYGEKRTTKFDHVIYLDKSARPVSWLVNTFWDDFSDSERPPHSYLAIDRIDWFNAVGLNTDNDGKDKETGEKYTFSDFKKNLDKLPTNTTAKIRALFLPEGIKDENPETILNTPSPLDGKNILIIDEVSRTGSTQKIAKKLLEMSFPDSHIETATFWRAGTVADGKGNTEMASSPVWYKPKSSLGRGIGDINEVYYIERYENNPTPQNRAKKFGAALLAAPLNLANEPGNRSRQLAKEIQLMHKEYQKNHILLSNPKVYSDNKWMNKLESLGIIVKDKKLANSDEKNKILSHIAEAIQNH